MEFNNLKYLLSERGEKTNLSKATKISTGNITDWFNPNRKSKPSAEALCKIADYYSCSVDYLLDRTQVKSFNKSYTYFPIYDQQAAAGAGLIGRDGDFEMKEIKTNLIPSNAVFGIYIKGYSMETKIPNGSIVLLNTKVDPILLNNKNVVVEVDGDVVCKQLKKQPDHIWLKSLNRDCSNEDRHIYDNNYRIIGEVVSVIV